MRLAQLLGGAALAWAFVNHASAQPPLSAHDDTIKVPEVEVRSGPTQIFYATSKLHWGDRVRVLREEEKGWLAIEPPMPGSFSWIDARAVERSGSTAIVSAPEAFVRVGSSLLNQPPTVQRTKVVKGAILTVFGEERAASDGTSWLAILPAPSEVRYIPVTAVSPAAPVQQLASVTPPTSVPPNYSQPAPQPAVAAASGPNPLWLEAQNAERSGNLLEAQRLYEQLAKQVATTDHALTLQCLSRSQYLRDYQRGATGSVQAGGSAPTAPYYSNPAGSDNRMAVNPYGQTCYPAGQQQAAASQYCYVADPCAPATTTVRLSQPQVAMSPVSRQTQTQSPPAAPQAQWYGPGRLYRAAFFLAGKPAYGLEPSNGQSWLYLTAGPGVNLDSYLEQKVQLYGAVVYQGELHTYYMTALGVSRAQSAQ